MFAGMQFCHHVWLCPAEIMQRCRPSGCLPVRPETLVVEAET